MNEENGRIAYRRALVLAHVKMTMQMRTDCSTRTAQIDSLMMSKKFTANMFLSLNCTGMLVQLQNSSVMIPVLRKDSTATLNLAELSVCKTTDFTY
jgi:hypothetical protein